MVDRKDGGLWALGGYLYQIIGTLGISVHAQNLKDPETPDDQLDVLFDLFGKDDIPNLKILVEKYGEDAVICGLEQTDGAVLVQFKYSRKTPPSPLGKVEIEKIISTFDQNFERAKKSNVDVRLCVLITNRPFVEGIEHGDEIWRSEEIKERNYSLHRVIDATFEGFEKKIKNFARKYGVTDVEIERGISILIGGLLQEGAQQNYNSRQFEINLVEKFTGSKTAEPITKEVLIPKCKANLQEYGTNVLGLEFWELRPIQRTIYTEIANLLSSNAFIGLYGDGGCGKSTLLWQLAWSNSQNCFCKVDMASNVTPRWLQNQINNQWRNIPSDKCLDENEYKALQRLLLANPMHQEIHQKPILWMGLDGVDENFHLSDQYGQLKNVAKWFWKVDQEAEKKVGPSDIVLIVTAREREDLLSLLDINPLFAQHQPKLIEIDKFDEIEIVEALKRVVPQKVYGNTGFSETYFEMIFEEKQYSGSIPSLPRKPAVSDSVLHSLSNPVFWQALLMLPPNLRELALDGDSNTLNQLADNILLWFNHKTGLRRSSNMFPRDLIPYLTMIAKNTEFERQFTRNIWINSLRNQGELFANNLFEEALSSGLIEMTSDRNWRWRYYFVHEYLIRQ